MNRLLVAFVLAGGLVAAGWTQSALAAEPSKIVDTAIGPVLADMDGRTLYIYEKDVNGQSYCTGACADNWPPYTATENDVASGDWSTIMREDGEKQWAYKGQPVYTWSQDEKSGDTTGDGKNNLWRAAKP